MEIIGFKGEKILVSIEDYKHLKQFKWSINNGGYAVGNMKNTKLIHRYIFIEILSHKELTSHNLIDHINGNKLDNRRENLRITSVKENSRNLKKRKDSSSIYFGVINYINNTFRTTLILNDESKTKLNAYYEIEIHAAYQYDLWLEQYKIIHSKKNNVDKPDNFIEYKKEKNGNLPKNIQLTKAKTYKINYRNKDYGRYKSLKEAEVQLQKIKDEFEKKRIKEIKNRPIKTNDKGECIIELFNKKKEKIRETIVDKEIYYDLMKYNWCLNDSGYVYSCINNKNIRLHRYIMNYTGDNYIDHINNNPLDNRKSNLRIVTPQQNSMNCNLRKNTSSKYVGVYWSNKDNRWISSIVINNKNKYIGCYINENDAAKARDIATKEHFGEFGKLNFSEIN